MIGRWTLVNAILVIILLALGAQIARTWMRTLPPTRGAVLSEERDGEGSRRRPSRANRSDPGDAEAVVAAITAKDLFDPSRSGTADATVDETPTPTEPTAPPEVIVVGVRFIGEDAEAMVENTAGGKEQRRVRTGDAIGDYTVEEIRETSVVLSAATGESVTLWLELGAGGAAPATPVRPGTARAATKPAAAPAAAAQRAERRRSAQRAARRRARDRRARQADAQLPQGVRERLEALRRNR